MRLTLANYIKFSLHAFLFLTVLISFIAITYPTITLLLALPKILPANSIAISALIISLPLSLKLSYQSQFYYLSLASRKLFLILLPFLFTMVIAFILKMNSGIDDIFYPTNLIGMTERARQGLIPLSFSSFPDFAANYHQSFLILAGGMAYFMGWTALHTLVILFPLLSVLIIVYLYLATQKVKKTALYSFSLIALFLFTASFPPAANWIDGTFFTNRYLTFFSIYFSNTWVLGTLGLFMLTFYLWKYENESIAQWPILIFLICFISINATIFISSWIAISILLSVEIVNRMKQKKPWKRTFYFLLATLMIYKLAHFIPSAFLEGSHYNTVDIRFKYFNSSYRIRDWTEACETFRLMGPWCLLSIYAIRLLWYQVASLFSKRNTSISFTQLIFLSAFIFPLFISFDNIDRWDAIHKFAILGIISGFLFLIQLAKKGNLTNREFYLFVIFSIAISLPYTYHLFKNSMVTTQNAFWKDLPGKKNEDVLYYLSAQHERIKIYPIYQVGDGELNQLASFSGDFIGNAYYPGFLVHIDHYDWPMTDENWSSAQSFYHYLKKSHLKNLIAVEKKNNPDFLKMIARFKKDPNFKVLIDQQHPIIFVHYIFYNYSKEES